MCQRFFNTLSRRASSLPLNSWIHSASALDARWFVTWGCCTHPWWSCDITLLHGGGKVARWTKTKLANSLKSVTVTLMKLSQGWDRNQTQMSMRGRSDGAALSRSSQWLQYIQEKVSGQFLRWKELPSWPGNTLSCVQDRYLGSGRCSQGILVAGHLDSSR
jgi:hypothetical protein